MDNGSKVLVALYCCSRMVYTALLSCVVWDLRRKYDGEEMSAQVSVSLLKQSRQPETLDQFKRSCLSFTANITANQQYKDPDTVVLPRICD